MNPGSELQDAAMPHALLRRLVMASVLPFAAGMLFAVLTEATLTERSSATPFAHGIREACEASRIFRTNVAAALTLISGTISGGITSVIGLAYFGRDLSSLCVKAFVQGTPLPQIAAAIAPHGLLEVPSLILAGAAGLAGVPLLWSFARGNRQAMRATLTASIVLAATSIALLIPAALIECHSTPVVLRWAM